MFNKVILVGNLTRDIEVRYANNGSAIGNTAIATSRKYTAASGEKKEEVCFIDITFFGRTAEVANQYLKKGSRILVEGRLKLDQWQDNSGQNRSKHSVVVETMQMLSGNSDAPSARPQGRDNASSPYNAQNSGYNQARNDNQSFNKNSQAKNTNDDYNNDVPEYDINADMGDNGDDVLPF
ncbi:single-stranded DNA-binding protein [Campylobacter geochelonis]|uniref:Single-stranded DNA-binding protein n=1 Tax=Campylobacter geochelonis TaxID=1780362 RepID=A0A128EGV2_9BACT|nr:single-stranded DNA-binding protein [Campylobacter geochelonis]QKF71018.1 single-stranded DNA binding protein [Campylobacter geochelonis]CZE47165.1 single-stranded DNA-binding protein [Campylobacter geochelonis]CZE47642.1 single-stranded DNA-binding protein [Campylobacter geochelonis]CZE50166.1 single-stranded DNA-binding protein [Campylobacter geochelonis]